MVNDYIVDDSSLDLVIIDSDLTADEKDISGKFKREIEGEVDYRAAGFSDLDISVLNRMQDISDYVRITNSRNSSDCRFKRYAKEMPRNDPLWNQCKRCRKVKEDCGYLPLVSRK